MELLPIKMEQNGNFFWAKNGFLQHRFGGYVGGDVLRVKRYENNDQRFTSIKTPKFYKTGVLIEADCNCFDVETDFNGYNEDRSSTKRHYVNKLFFNNHNELVFEQRDFRRYATPEGQILKHFGNSTIHLANNGIGVYKKGETNFYTYEYLEGKFKAEQEKRKTQEINLTYETRKYELNGTLLPEIVF
jgi:hypothetical protein